MTETNQKNESTMSDAPAQSAPEAASAETDKTASETKKPATQTEPNKLPSGQHWWWGTGRRKAAVARVRLRPGSGDFIVNQRKYNEYFNGERDQNDLLSPLVKTGTKGSVDVHVNVFGGGCTRQAGAIVLGLGRALRRYDERLEPTLRDNGFLTRDPRRVERKKPGQPGARRRFQFSKR